MEDSKPEIFDNTLLFSPSSAGKQIPTIQEDLELYCCKLIDYTLDVDIFRRIEAELNEELDRKMRTVFEHKLHRFSAIEKELRLSPESLALYYDMLQQDGDLLISYKPIKEKDALQLLNELLASKRLLRHNVCVRASPISLLYYLSKHANGPGKVLLSLQDEKEGEL